MYKDRTKNYDQEIREEYLIDDTPVATPSVASPWYKPRADKSCHYL